MERGLGSELSSETSSARKEDGCSLIEMGLQGEPYNGHTKNRTGHLVGD